jgi:hypothetical protein
LQSFPRVGRQSGGVGESGAIVPVHADTESVREVFRNLVSMEQAELRRLALNALTAEDF